MSVSRKCQYALRAVFELARHYREGPIASTEIADAQAIPKRFLDVILSQLKQAGFISSHRGNEGGYVLERDPASLAVGEVIRFIEGPLVPVECLADAGPPSCPLKGTCIFMPMWERAREAVAEVYDGTTFGALVELQRARESEYVPEYAI